MPARDAAQWPGGDSGGHAVERRLRPAVAHRRVRDRAGRAGAPRIWLITTNNNTHALRFYQRRGFDLVRLDRGGVDRARKLKPGIPAHDDGIPIRHELELELRLR